MASSHITTDSASINPNSPHEHSNAKLPTNDDAEDEQSAQNGVRQGLRRFYDRNFGLLLVFLAQTCGSIMNVAVKLLTNDPTIRFHAFEMIFIRMLCTTIIGSTYMWYHNIPHFPVGPKSLRKLLVLRGTAGFIGLFGLYYSLAWLELADATVITFIVPTVTAIVCFVWLGESYTIREALAGLIAFSGCLLVARPPWLFPVASSNPGLDDPIVHVLNFVLTGVSDDTPSSPSISPHQRAIAITVAIVGTFASSIAYATIRVIGNRAHSLISVNYFAGVATIGSAFFLLIHPDLHFIMPKTLDQWGLMAIIGFTGFLLQFLLTEGLQREKAGRATNLTYLQIVFALIIERVIWRTTPPAQSLFGAVLIISAAMWISLQKSVAMVVQKNPEIGEESSLLRNEE